MLREPLGQAQKEYPVICLTLRPYLCSCFGPRPNTMQSESAIGSKSINKITKSHGSPTLHPTKPRHINRIFGSSGGGHYSNR